MKNSKTIFRIERRKSHYGTLDKRFLANPALGWRAKGMLAYLLLKPDDWKLMLCDLEKQSTDGRDSCRAGLNELIAQLYVRRCCVRDPHTKKIIRWEYVVFETPELARAAQPEQSATLFEQFDPTPGDQSNAGIANPHFQQNKPETGLPEVAQPEVALPVPANPLLPINDGTNKQFTNDDDGTKEPFSSSQENGADSFVVVSTGDSFEDSVLIMASVGFPPADARSILQRTTAAGNDASAVRVKQVLTHAMKRRPTHRSGFIVKALERGWNLKPIDTSRVNDAELQARRERERDQTQQQDRGTAEELERQNRVIDALSPEEWKAVIDRMLPNVAPNFHARFTSSAARNSPLVRYEVCQNIQKNEHPAREVTHA